MFEDAVEIAVAGPLSRPDPSRLADHGRRLQVATQVISVIAKAATVVADPRVNHASDRRKVRR